VLELRLQLIEGHGAQARANFREQVAVSLGHFAIIPYSDVTILSIGRAETPSREDSVSARGGRAAPGRSAGGPAQGPSAARRARTSARPASREGRTHKSTPRTPH